jgi:hypothetical protein
VPLRAAQSASVVWTQETTPAALRQQAPVGGGGGEHSVFVHRTLSPRYVPPAALHWSCVITLHTTPLGEATQHAPVTGGGGQPAASQVEPSPW